jgi:nucleoside-diphosphate-sugar epimerase
VAHDDAASAVVASLRVPAGVYNVGDDQPVRHREYVDALADAMNVRHPKLPPAWTATLAGSLGRTVARSLQLSHRKLREASGWAPSFPSVREGWRATVAATASDEPSRAQAA